MKTTLILGKNIRFTADIHDSASRDVFRLLVEKAIEGADVPSSNAAVPSVPGNIATASTQHERLRKLCVMKCECGHVSTVLQGSDFGAGSVLHCRRCDKDNEVQTLEESFGECAECGHRFYNVWLLNGTRVYRCKGCGRYVDIALRADGRLVSVNLLDADSEAE